MSRVFGKRETEEQTRERLHKLCKEGDYGICPPPMDAYVAICELRDFFLGRDWYESFPDEMKPTIREVVDQIEKKFRFRFWHKAPKRCNCGCRKSMVALEAVYELSDFFLGSDYYIALPVGVEQEVSEIVYQIERRYR